MVSQFDCADNAFLDRQPDAAPRISDGHRPIIARRTIASEEGREDSILQYADLVMDLRSMRAKRGGRTIQLRPTEFRILKLLLEQPERVFTRDQLKAGVWGHSVKLDPRSINTYLGRLRRALTASGEANIIRTITGFGYSLDANCSDM